MTETTGGSDVGRSQTRAVRDGDGWQLYGRKWFQIEGASEAQLAKEKETGVDFGYIDFELFTVDEIANMKIINLDMRDETGKIVANPAMIKYDPDPNNAEYVCKPVVNESNTITDI